MLPQRRIELIDVDALRELEGIVVEADIALAMRVLLALGIGLGDPEQCLAVAPAGHVAVLMFQLESQRTEHLGVEGLGALEITDADDQVVDADDACHAGLHSADDCLMPNKTHGSPICHALPM